jgi:hypothetical protein
MASSAYCPATDVKSNASSLPTTTQEPVTIPEIDLKNLEEQEKLKTGKNFV